MSLLDTILQSPVFQKYFGLPAGTQQGVFTDYLGQSDPRTGNLYNNYKGIVFAAINTIARSMAAAEWDLTKNSKSADPQREVLKQHAFLELIENPNPSLSKFDLVFGSAVFEEIAGEWFWYFALGKNSKEPKEIYLLHPSKTKVVIDKATGEVVGYKYKQNSVGEGIFLEADEVLHHKNFNPNNPYRGLGTLQAGLTYAETEQFSSSFTRNFFKNNGTPAGVIMIDTNNGDEFEKFKRKWKEEYGGVENAGKVAFLRGKEAKFTKLSLGLNELDMKALRELSEDSILKMFGVPRPLLGFADSNGLGRGNVETLEYIFAKYNIDFKLKQMDDTMQIAVDRFWPEQKLTVIHRDVIPEDREAVLAEEKAGVDIWLTRNDIRQRRGLERRKGLDMLYHAANQMDIEDSTDPEKAKSASVRVVIGQKKK